jgi:hypothetical protein
MVTQCVPPSPPVPFTCKSDPCSPDRFRVPPNASLHGTVQASLVGLKQNLPRAKALPRASKIQLDSLAQAACLKGATRGEWFASATQGERHAPDRHFQRHRSSYCRPALKALTRFETTGDCIQIVDRCIEIVDDRSTGVENWNKLGDRPTSVRTPF